MSKFKWRWSVCYRCGKSCYGQFKTAHECCNKCKEEAAKLFAEAMKRKGKGIGKVYK